MCIFTRFGVFFEIFVHTKNKKRHPGGWRNCDFRFTLSCSIFPIKEKPCGKGEPEWVAGHGVMP